MNQSKLTVLAAVVALAVALPPQLPTGFPQMPMGMPQMPAMPQMPMGMPQMPMEMSQMPMGMPQMPAMPQMPMGMPQMPMEMPQMPMGLPQMPMGLPQMPMGMPQMPMGMPQMPMGMPQIPQQPQQQQQAQQAPQAPQTPINIPFGMGNNFGAPNTLGGLFGGMGGLQAPQQQQQQQARPNYMWVCLEEVFPANLRATAGLPGEVTNLLDEYVMHASVLVGPTTQEATGFQRQLREGANYWTSVMTSLRNMDTSNPTEWAKTKMSGIQGSSKYSSVQGTMLMQNSERCYRTSEPVSCSPNDVQQFTNNFAQSHPGFNLYSDNCQKYACSALSHCSGKTEGAAQCNADTCYNQMMWNPLNEKNPGCNSELAYDKRNKPKPAANAFPFANFGFGNLFNAKPTTTESAADNALNKFIFNGIQKQSHESEFVPDELADFFPMHTKKGQEILLEALKKDDEAKAAAAAANN